MSDSESDTEFVRGVSLYGMQPRRSVVTPIGLQEATYVYVMPDPAQMYPANWPALRELASRESIVSPVMKAMVHSYRKV